jgi:uncharacterized protein with HEPN domain
MDVAAFATNEMAQSAVERKFEIIGEALNQLAKLDATLAARIPDLPKIVAFRNQLIHGYATVNVNTVWNVAQNALPPLFDAVQVLMNELGEA